MKTTIRYTEVKEQELKREDIDKMVGSMVLDLCNILLNENIVQHRDEARVLLHEIFKNKSEMDILIADKAKALLDSGRVQFVYDSGYYKNKGIVD